MKKIVVILKEWWLPLTILLIGLFLLVTGGIGFFTESFQMLIKKTLLVALWYALTYLIRIMRIGHINWNVLDPKYKVLYYFVLLIGSALIIAWG